MNRLTEGKNLNKMVQLKNDYLKNLEVDFLYHLGFDTKTHDFPKMFGDVKFVCMGGTPHRMHDFAKIIRQELGVKEELVDLCASAKRFAFYKIGPVISVSHGMGMPSLSILLHELIKLVAYAKCKDPVFIRIGTSGGIGVEPGTVIVTSEPVNGFLKSEHEFVILGKRIVRPVTFDKDLANDLVLCSLPDDDFKIVCAKTMASDDFYEGQGRIDGAICEHTENDKMNFLHRSYEVGVRNIEMESTMLASLTNVVGIRSADVCVTFLDRFNGDQVNITKGNKTQFENRPQIVVARYIMKQLTK